MIINYFNNFFKLYFILLLIFACSHQSYGQYNVIKVDLFGGVLSPLKVYRGSYERSFGKSFSGGLSLESGRFAESETFQGNTLIESSILKGWGFVPEARFYPGRKNDAPIGFFLGSHVIYRKLNEEYNFSGQSATNSGYFFSIGGDIGYKIPIGRVNLEILGGYGSAAGKYSNQEVSPAETEADDASLPIRFEICLGFIFPKYSADEEIKKGLPSSINEGNSELAKIIIYRPKKAYGLAIEYDLYVNDKFLTRLENGTYYEYELLGNQEVTFKAKTEVTETLRFQVEKGRTYYMKSGLKMGVVVGRPSLEIVSQTKALKEIKKLVATQS